MKYLYLVLIGAFFSIVFFSCSKSDNNPSPEPPAPERFTVTSVSPGHDSAYLGCVVTINGKNFITDTSKIRILMGDRRPVISATTEKITFTVPVNLMPIAPGERKDYGFSFNMEGRSGDTIITLGLSYHEPQGWSYETIRSNKQTAGVITFASDSIGFILGSAWVYRTKNGGQTWETGDVGGGYALSSFDGQHVWQDNLSRVIASDDYGARFFVPNNAFQFDRSVIGIYMTSATTGLVMGQDQNLYYVNGTPVLAANASIKFTSKYFTATPDKLNMINSNWSRFSVIDEKNLMLAGFAKIGGVPTCIITHEKDGVFTEYDLGAVTSAVYPKGVQLVDANTAFLIDGNSDILKLTGATTWTKLNQKATAFCFKDATTGYAVYDGKILKTTDGGANWQTEFTLQPNETISVMCYRNGKVWAAGNNATNLIALKYNP